jgi:primosomal protein N' (replication factor Y)
MRQAEAQHAVSVAVPLPVQSTFSYAVGGGRPLPERGVRVVVPFGARRVIGVVTGPGGAPQGKPLKDVIEVLDESPLVAPRLLDLAEWVASHYLAPPGECFRLVLPPAGIAASRSVARAIRPAADANADVNASGAKASGANATGSDASAADEPADDDPVLAALASGPLRVSTLARRLKADPSSRLARLKAAGLVAIDQELRRAGFQAVRVAQRTDAQAEPKGRAQAEVLERLERAGGQRSPSCCGTGHRCAARSRRWRRQGRS